MGDWGVGGGEASRWQGSIRMGADEALLNPDTSATFKAPPKTVLKDWQTMVKWKGQLMSNPLQMTC